MAQHDYVIDNANGSTVRGDINNALAAVASTNKGTARPSTAYAGQLWVDDNTPSSSVWSLFFYDGSDDILLGYVNTTTNLFFPEGGVKGSDVASASTLNLDTTYADLVDVTGTTTVTAITLAEGRSRVVRFTGALTLTHGSSLVLPTAANVTTAAGDFAVFRGYAGGVVRCASYQRADGTPVGLVAATQSQMEAASSNIVYATPGRLVNHPGVDKVKVTATVSGVTLTQRTGYGGSISRTTTGEYAITFSTAFSDAYYDFKWGAERTSGGVLPLCGIKNGSRTTGGCSVQIFDVAGNAFDPPFVSFSFGGDQ